METTGKEMTIIDPADVKAEVTTYLGSVIDDAQETALAINDETTCAKAIELGSTVKGKIAQLEKKRVEIYEPLRKGLEALRLEYDNPIKLGKQIEKTLAAAVVDFRLKQKREADRIRLEKEAQARREKEEADRKEREAAAERDRIIRERQLEEQRRRDEEQARIKAEKEAEEGRRREEARKSKEEADARAAKIKEEEDARLAGAQQAHDVGLPDRSGQILETRTSIAPIPAPLPSAAERQAVQDAEAQKERERVAEEERVRKQKEDDQKKRDAEAEHLRKLDEEAAQAREKAALTEAEASQQVSVARPDERMRTSVTWKYEVPNEDAFRTLCLAIGQRRAPVEYAGFDPENPQKFRAAAIGKDVTRLKDQFDGTAVGIRTWPEEGGSFKVAKETV